MDLRPVNESDSGDLFKWRNHPKTRAASLTDKEIDVSEHDRWFANSLKDPDRYIWIVNNQMSKLGVCRFDVDRKCKIATVSINLNPDFIGLGLGKNMLSASIVKQRKVTEIEKIHAVIKPENSASIALFKSCGFIEKGSESNLLFELAF